MFTDITLTTLETITGFGITDGAFLFQLDEIQDATIANTQDSQEITGKGGRRLNSIKRNKAVTVSGTNGLLSGGLLELQTGNKFVESNEAKVMWTDYLTISANAATTSYVAIGTAGAEIENLYIKNSDGSLGTKLTQAAAVGEGAFTYNPETKALAFNSGDYADGTEIAVFYYRNIQAHVLDNLSDKYSEKCQLYIDAFGEDKCGNIYRVQFYIPKADFNGNFDIQMGGDQVVHAFEANSLTGACGANGTLWTFTVFGVDTADEAGG